jgi:hypothetical protein
MRRRSKPLSCERYSINGRGGFFFYFFFSPFLSFPFFLSLGSVCPRVNSCEKWNLCGNGFFTWCVEDGVAWR